MVTKQMGGAILIHILVHLVDAEDSYFMHGRQFGYQHYQKDREVDGKSHHIIMRIMSTQKESMTESLGSAESIKF
jgi:hypothetical protein